jgi:chromosomal replication initiation ATPase DnaA
VHCSGEGKVLAAPTEAPPDARVLARYPNELPTLNLVLIACPFCGNDTTSNPPLELPEDAEGVSFASIKEFDHQAAALGALTQLLKRGAGWLSLVGGYGSGKSTLFYATLRALHASGLRCRYLTATRLQNLLFAALKDGALQALLETLGRAPVLAIDELDNEAFQPAAESWVNELMNARYQGAGRTITLLACNVLASPIPPRVISRMRDRRFSLIDLGDTDLRDMADTAPVHNPWAGAWDRGEGEL